ncbi:MAG: toprim domain-containing protein [Magnetococcus sp. MYC-9]
MDNPVDAFRQAMHDAGLVYQGEIIQDGQLHRVHLQGDKPATKNGWYLLFPDPPISGSFGSWRLGVQRIWTCSHDRDRQRDPALRQQLLQRQQIAHQAEQQQRLERWQGVAVQAARIWTSAVPADPGHPYLRRKEVQTHGIRQGRWQKSVELEPGVWRQMAVENTLLVPLCDEDGRLWSLQAIFPERHAVLGRDKDFLTGGRKSGLFYCLPDQSGRGSGESVFSLASYHKSATDRVMLFAEGYATAATLFEQTGYLTFVCFDAGNIKPVATSVSRFFPSFSKVVAADNDRETEGNPGVTKATEAAREIGGVVLVPRFGDGEPGSDWNDWAANRREVCHG